jgi:hypothetical protein
MWLAMVLVCSNVYASSCLVITAPKDLKNSREKCNYVASEKSTALMKKDTVQYAVPMCEEITMGTVL